MEPEDKEESTLSESQEFVEEFGESEAPKPAELLPESEWVTGEPAVLLPHLPDNTKVEEPIPDDLKIFDKQGNEIPLENLPEVDAEDVISSVSVEPAGEKTPTVVKTFLAEIEEFRDRLRKEALCLQPGPIAAAHFKLVDEALIHLAKALVKLGFSR